MDIPLWVWYFGGALIFLALVNKISNATQDLFILLEDIRDELRAANEADNVGERVEHRRQTEMSTELSGLNAELRIEQERKEQVDKGSSEGSEDRN